MKDRLLHTPEGVRDIYNVECARKSVLENKLKNKLRLYGYEEIRTPSFEFFEIFNTERGTVRAKEMYKFFDRGGQYPCAQTGYYTFHCPRGFKVLWR